MSDLQAIRDEGDELYMSFLDPADWFRANWMTIAAALRELEWRTIETAPKDGTSMLLCRITDNTGYNRRPIHGKYFEDWMFGKPAWGWHGMAWTDSEPPTHWMPLPAPPTGKDTPCN